MYESAEPQIWTDDDFSIRFDTKPLVILAPEAGIPVLDLADTLEMLQQLKNPKNYGWLFQGSPSRIKNPNDGEAILKALKAIEREPIIRPVPPKLLARGSYIKPKTTRRAKESVLGAPPLEPESRSRPHTEIQYHLLKLGSDMGIDVWVARNDKGRTWKGKRFSDVARMRTSLPEQFDPQTQQIVELIDVLWLDGDGIICAFEVEHSTSIYGGLLRMSDLLARRPNINIKLFIVAPDERRDQVLKELSRPTFQKLKLNQVCRFIPYSKMRDTVERFGDDAQHLRPDFIDSIAEDCGGK